MKKRLLFNLTLFTSSILSFSGTSQCFVYQDTTVAGGGQGNYTTYIRDGSMKLLETQRIDYMNNNNSVRDTAFYNPDQSLDKVETYFIVGGNWRSTIQLVYDGMGKITRIEESGFNGSPWTKAFNLSYNGSGQLTDMILDAFSITGSPEGMMANFMNMTYTGSNVTYVELVGDFGGGVDTFEMGVTYDDKPNLSDQLMFREAPDVLMFFAVNNMLDITFINDESIANAGDKGIDRIITYDLDNKVATIEELPSVFSSNNQTVRYDWDCSAGIQEKEENTFLLFPNPVINELNIQADFNAQNYLVFNLNGMQMLGGTVNSNRIDVSSLSPGVYFIQINNSEFVRFIKE